MGKIASDDTLNTFNSYNNALFDLRIELIEMISQLQIKSLATLLPSVCRCAKCLKNICITKLQQKFIATRVSYVCLTYQIFKPKHTSKGIPLNHCITNPLTQLLTNNINIKKYIIKDFLHNAATKHHYLS